MGYPYEILSSRINRLLPNHHFEYIISTADYVFRKPSKRIFEVALKKAKLSPQDVIYCGDSFDYDVLGALHSDITPVWYHKKSTIPNAKESTFITVENWSELIAMLEKL
jgi:putative hydrolase of the HAD superfamily